MKITPVWASIALFAPHALAISATVTTSASATSTSTAPTCTASLIDTLCDYPEPDIAFAVAEDSRASCWDYCNDHQPCSFVIFYPQNPYLGDGSCWLYPGESYNASAASTDCSNPFLEVYNTPVCTGTATTTTTGGCAATATPTPIASVCDYPAPADDCWDDCYASSGAPNCLSLCAEADSCSYVVFNPRGGSTSPYASGTCWVYADGSYNASAAGTCSGDAEQFVYNNVCPKPSSSLSSSSATATGTNSASTTSSATGSSVTAAADSVKNSIKKNSASGPWIANPLALGAVVLMLQAI